MQRPERILSAQVVVPSHHHDVRPPPVLAGPLIVAPRGRKPTDPGAQCFVLGQERQPEKGGVLFGGRHQRRSSWRGDAVHWNGASCCPAHGGEWTLATIARLPCDEGAILAGSCNGPVTNGPWILAATILGSSMAFIDGTVVNMALPALQSALHAKLADVQWVVESYALFLATLLLVGGSLAACSSFSRSI
jgi:hypothetical protein